MERAIELARPHRTHSNPRVGAVVVNRDGTIVGEGAHLGRGRPHAEVVALAQAGGSARGATIYSTLEPCTVDGLTPPCTAALIEAGISEVVVGSLDPDPRVNGTGVATLRAAGLEVRVGVLETEVEDLDPGYFWHRRTGLPRVTYKYAMTLDGATAAHDGTSQWITGAGARSDVHRLRSEADAVVVGAGTLRTDNPALSVRLEGYAGHQPRAVVVSGDETLPIHAQIWDRQPIVIATRAISIPSGDLVVVSGSGGQPDPTASCQALADLGLLEILLEGGPTLASAWWRAGVVGRGIVYVGKLVGGGGGMSPMGGMFDTMGDATPVEITSVTQFDGDVRIEFDRPKH